MKSFNQYLTESLDKPVDFDLTDDTNVPRKIVGIFEVNGTKYGMTLEETNFNRIYMLSMYRINNKVPRLWSFKSAGDLRASLATVLNFMERTFPLIKNRVDGIVIKIPGSSPAAKFNDFMQRIIKRSQVKLFTPVPVKQTEVKEAWELIFVVRKGVSPTELFKAKQFKKYGITDAPTAEAFEDIKPSLPVKQKVSEEPSKKYSFKNLDVKDITIDSDVFDKISRVQKKDVIRIGTPYDNLSKKLTAIQEANVKDIYITFITSQRNLYNFLHTNILTKTVINRLNKIDKEHTDYWDRYYAKKEYITSGNVLQNILNGIKKKSPAFYTMFYHNREDRDGVLYSLRYTLTEDYELESDIIEKSKEVIPKLSKIDIVILKQFLKYELSENISRKEIFTTNIEPSELESDLPGQGKFDYDSIEKELYRINEGEDENVKKKVSYLMNDLGYDDEYKKLNLTQRNSVMAYTGSSYSDYNRILRDSFSYYAKGEHEEAVNEMSNSYYTKGVAAVASVFDEMKPLSTGLWVYRGTHLPSEAIEMLEEGKPFSDPAFLSTSVMSGISFGLSNAKFRIYLPKGSKVIPILDNSQNDGEREVILPPMSVQKVIRIDKLGSENYFITSVFVGSVYKDFLEKLKLDSNHKQINEAEVKKEQPKKYDPNEKFASKVDLDMLRYTAHMINKKKLIIKK